MFHLLLSSSSWGILDSEALNLVAHSSDLAGELAGVVAGDAGGDDSTADTAGTAEVHLAANVNIGDYQAQVSNRPRLHQNYQLRLPFLSSQRRGRWRRMARG